MSDLPAITVIMPVRNEASFIERSLGSVLAQDYPPDHLEVLVVDGMSTDGTREAVQRLAREAGAKGWASVRLLDNPAHIVPTGLNLGLQQARGEVIVRVDGHCEIAPDYLRRCVDALRATGADCVGGPMVTVGSTPTARAIALAQSSHFGVGGVAFRTGRRKAGYVDTVAFGAYRREVFDRIGGFDEELVRNQDDEFNFRLIQSGGRIWLDPSIRSTYYSRASLRGLWRQYFQYGFYKVRVIQKRGAVPSWRHLVPAAFVAAVVVSLIWAWVTGQPFWLMSVAAPYLAANLGASVWLARGDSSTLRVLPLAFLALHLGYGAGFLWGLVRFAGRAGQNPT